MTRLERNMVSNVRLKSSFDLEEYNGDQKGHIEYLSQGVFSITYCFILPSCVLQLSITLIKIVVNECL